MDYGQTLMSLMFTCLILMRNSKWLVKCADQNLNSNFFPTGKQMEHVHPDCNSPNTCTHQEVIGMQVHCYAMSLCGNMMLGIVLSTRSPEYITVYVTEFQLLRLKHDTLQITIFSNSFLTHKYLTKDFVNN